MSKETTVVDSSPPEVIARAIKKVNQTPGLRIRTGTEALWKLFKAPGHALPRSEMEESFGALDLHFGWFCRRVAEELGANAPNALALVDCSTTEHEDQLLTLKSSVVAAMAGAPKQR
jgi:hypothetical protein